MSTLSEGANPKFFSVPTNSALKGCRGIVFIHGVQMGGLAVGKSFSGLYLRTCKV